MYVFALKRGSPICCVLLTQYKTRIGADESVLIHREQTIYWIFTQIKLSSIYRHKPIATYWALKKRQALFTI